MTEKDNQNTGKEEKALTSKKSLDVGNETFNQLLPKGFKTLAMADEVRRETLDVLVERRYSLSDARKRINKIEELALTGNDEGEMIKRRLIDSNPMLPIVSIDPMEEFRRRMGYSTDREKLENNLIKALSFKEGFERLALGLSLLMGKDYQNMEQLNQDFKNITRTEVILTSLISRPPELFLNLGWSEKNLKERFGIDLEDTFKEDISIRKKLFGRELAYFVGANPLGLLIAEEGVNPNRKYPNDSYAQLGITGLSGMIELRPFKRRVRSDIEQLIPLIISNYRLHERLMTGRENAMLDGLTKLDRIAVDRIIPDATIYADLPLENIIARLNTKERLEFNRLQGEMNLAISRSVLIDYVENKALSVEEILRLIGVLDNVPPFLIDSEQIFAGYFYPFGPGVKFLDEDLQPILYTPYKPYYLREVLHGIHYESIDLGKQNRTMIGIFNKLSSQAEAMAFSVIDESGDDPSIIEGIKADMKLLMDIDLVIRPNMNVVNISKWESLHSEGEKIDFVPTVKFGADEAKHIFEVLKMIPLPLLSQVKRIRKEVEDSFPIEMLMEGVMALGEYNSSQREITLYVDPTKPFIFNKPEFLEMRTYVLVHEIAHGIWREMDDATKTRWSEISNWGEQNQEKNLANFLTMYSHKMNEEEDFCEHFALYVLHAQEFREALKGNLVIFEKYNFIKGYISKKCGREYEYPQFSKWTIQQLHGAIDAQITKMNEAQLIEVMQVQEMEDHVTAQKALDQIRDGSSSDEIDEILDEEEFDKRVGEDFTVESTMEAQYRIDKKREILLDFASYFCGYLSEEESRIVAKELYELIETEEIKQAEGLINEIIEEEDVIEDLWLYIKELNI